VVHLGSHGADGATTQDETITSVWNNVFSGNTVQRVDGMPLWYYHNYRITNVNTESLLAPIDDNGYIHGDGQCGAWAKLMLDVLKAQGIDQQNDYVVIQPSSASGFIVNEWQFNGAGTGDAAIAVIPGFDRDAIVAEYPYLNVLPANGDDINAQGTGYTWRFADVSDGAGIEGKGPNANPASVFGNHQFVVEVNTGTDTTWYDPSYGSVYSGATQDARELYFDDQSLAGYFVYVNADVRESAIQEDLNGNGNMTDIVSSPVYLLKKNAIGTREVSAMRVDY